jgi:hypothetical protein
MRHAMAMIELIFAIVIIAISVITIPTMMTVANNAAKGIVIDEDAMARLSGWTLDKFQARWDRDYNATNSGPLVMNPNSGDLNCTRAGGYRWGSEENISSMQCNMLANPSIIPSTAGYGIGEANGSLAFGLNMLNGGSETISVTTSSGATVNITATYEVDYVDSTVTPLTGSNTQTATWNLGSSGSMIPGTTGTTSHLKRVVTRFQNTGLGVDTTLTFFKSNKGN